MRSVLLDDLLQAERNLVGAGAIGANDVVDRHRRVTRAIAVYDHEK
jgi:hypothetical protein